MAIAKKGIDPVQIHRAWLQGWEGDNGVRERARTFPELAEKLQINEAEVRYLARDFRPAKKSWHQERRELDFKRSKLAVKKMLDREADILSEIYAQQYEVNSHIIEQYRETEYNGSGFPPSHTEAMRAARENRELAEKLEGVAETDSGGQTYNVIITNYGQAVNKETGVLEEDWSLLEKTEVVPDGDAGVEA